MSLESSESQDPIALQHHLAEILGEPTFVADRKIRPLSGCLMVNTLRNCSRSFYSYFKRPSEEEVE